MIWFLPYINFLSTQSKKKFVNNHYADLLYPKNIWNY